MERYRYVGVREIPNVLFVQKISTCFCKARYNRLCSVFGKVPKSRKAPTVCYKQDLLLLSNFSLQIVLVLSFACLHRRNEGVRRS